MSEPELLSVHIPKSAGNSVAALLKRHYGPKLLTLYHDFRPGVDYGRRLRRARARAVHGHVSLDLLRAHFPAAQTAVWFRHPVARLVSYYFYWRKLRPHGNPNHERFIREGWGLERLARLLQDEVSGYLGELRVSELDFVGIVEHFEEDSARFTSYLQMLSPPTRNPLTKLLTHLRPHKPHANRNRRKTPVSTEVQAALVGILSEEMALYEQALSARRRQLV